MLQVILKFDQNLVSFLLQNWSKFNQKSIKKCYPIQSWFCNRYFFGFCSIFDKFLDQFWVQNCFKNGKNASPGSAYALQKRIWVLRSLQDRFWIDFSASNDQKCDLASTKCTSMFVLNVKTQSFCNAFSNFLTFFQSKRTSSCPKLVPNHYFCLRGDPFFMSLGEVSLSRRN